MNFKIVNAKNLKKEFKKKTTKIWHLFTEILFISQLTDI